MDNDDKITHQIAMGIHLLCKESSRCISCPFYRSKCIFGEPRPRDWFSEPREKHKIAQQVNELKEIQESDKPRNIFETRALFEQDKSKTTQENITEQKTVEVEQDNSEDIKEKEPGVVAEEQTVIEQVVEKQNTDIATVEDETKVEEELHTPTNVTSLQSIWQIKGPIEDNKLFTKRTYVCSVCGYQRESVLTPIGPCPECEQRKSADLFKKFKQD